MAPDEADADPTTDGYSKFIIIRLSGIFHFCHAHFTRFTLSKKRDTVLIIDSVSMKVGHLGYFIGDAPIGKLQT
jgi:hypothetical protein